MKKLLSVVIALAVAAVLILTKRTPQDIASAASGPTNDIVINKEKMPPGFAEATAERPQTVEDLFSIHDGRSGLGTQ